MDEVGREIKRLDEDLLRLFEKAGDEIKISAQLLSEIAERGSETVSSDLLDFAESRRQVADELNAEFKKVRERRDSLMVELVLNSQ